MVFLIQKSRSLSAQHLPVVSGQNVCGWTWRRRGLFANRSFNNVRLCQHKRHSASLLLLLPPPFSFLFTGGPHGLIIYKQARGVDGNKNYPIFHIRLLRGQTGLGAPLGEVGPLLSDAPEQADQTPLLRILAFLPISILVAFFHVGEQWLKWLYWSSLMGSQMKPGRAREINWFVLRAAAHHPVARRPLLSAL